MSDPCLQETQNNNSMQTKGQSLECTLCLVPVWCRCGEEHIVGAVRARQQHRQRKQQRQPQLPAAPAGAQLLADRAHRRHRDTRPYEPPDTPYSTVQHTLDNLQLIFNRELELRIKRAK